MVHDPDILLGWRRGLAPCPLCLICNKTFLVARSIPTTVRFMQLYPFPAHRIFWRFTFLTQCRTLKQPGIELTPGDASLFRDLNSSVDSFNAAVKASRKRKKATENDAEMDEDADLHCKPFHTLFGAQRQAFTLFSSQS